MHLVLAASYPLPHKAFLQIMVCKASFKGSNCKFPESRTLLGALIMHAVNTREAILYNDGATDAFYNVTVVESKVYLVESVHIASIVSLIGVRW